ncbi:hypothetical protein JEY40_16130 [Bradyrhizobium japonicum]|nr:hypothetical protein [Bradyrhizobium japonicum]UQD75947.1 hypothetical protein JEY40_16130 [Bradyrhizobium japonicum]
MPTATQGRGLRVAAVQKLGGLPGLFVIERSKRHRSHRGLQDIARHLD